MEIRLASKLLRSGGLIYLRFPNGLLHSRVYRLAYICQISNLVRRFLVFHQYSFTPQYIKNLLDDHGFAQITVLNSPLTEGDPYELFPGQTFAQHVKRLLHLIARSARTVSGGKLLLSSSLDVTAIKFHPVESNW